MKNCTRLDVVTANIKAESNIKLTSEKSSAHTWNLRKKSMPSEAWCVSDQSLKISESIGESDSSLDVSIVYEKKLKKFINKIEFNLNQTGEKQPSKLSNKIIHELNNLSSAANELAQRLSNANTSTDLVEDVQAELPSEISDE